MLQKCKSLYIELRLLETAEGNQDILRICEIRRQLMVFPTKIQHQAHDSLADSGLYTSREAALMLKKINDGER